MNSLLNKESFEEIPSSQKIDQLEQEISDILELEELDSHIYLNFSMSE